MTGLRHSSPQATMLHRLRLREKVTMPSDERLLGWIESRAGGYLAAFVAKPEAKRRAPATRQFGSPDEARQWVMKEAHAVGAPVEWLAEALPLDHLPH